MIVAQEMEKTVDEEHVELLAEGAAVLRCLARGNRNGDDDVAEEVRLDTGELPFPQRK